MQVWLSERAKIYGKIESTLDPKDPHGIALQLVAGEFTKAGKPALYHHRGVFYEWPGTRYVECEDDYIKSRIYAFLSQSFVQTEAGKAPFKPNRAIAANVFDALKAITDGHGSRRAIAALHFQLGWWELRVQP